MPSYIMFWGPQKAASRLMHSTFLPALHGFAVELTNYFIIKQHHTKPKRIPDFVMFAPDYVHSSAGIRCLYKLAADLKSLGFEVAIHGSLIGNPDSVLPLISLKGATKAAQHGAWLIYPEVIRGNPAAAKNVIRWVLNRPGLLGGDEVFGDDEHVFIYSDVYAQYVRNPIRGRIYMPTIDRSLFYPPPPGTGRSLECFYVGKSKFKPGIFNPDNVFEITRSMPPRSELGKLLRASKTLYCFDNSTALTYEALFCGCRVMIIPDGTQTWTDYEKLELGTDGITWGVLPATTETFEPKVLQERLNKHENTYQDQLRFLAKYTQDLSPSKYFNYLAVAGQAGE